MIHLILVLIVQLFPSFALANFETPYGNQVDSLTRTSLLNSRTLETSETSQQVCLIDSTRQFSINDVQGLRQTFSSVAILKNAVFNPGDSTRFVVTWQSNQDGSGLGIMARLYDVDPFGNVLPLTNAFQVNTLIIFDQKQPKVAALEDGNFVIVYQSTVSIPDATPSRQERIVFQMFDNNGNALGTESQLSRIQSQRQDINPKISALSGEIPGFVITWISSLFTETGDMGSQDVMAQIFAADGSERTTEFRINNRGDVAADTLSVTGISNGSFVLAWTSLQPGCSPRSVYAQRFDQLGNPDSPAFPVNDFTTNDAYEPYVAGLNDGSFVISWTVNEISSNGGNIIVQKYSSNGAPVGIPTLVNSFTDNIQSGSVIVPRQDDAGYLILWNSLMQDGDDFGIYGQFFNADDDFDGPEFVATPDTIGSQTLPAAAIFKDNQMVMTWTVNNQMILGNLLKCRQNCVLSEWSDWSQCSAECDGGLQNRTRTILVPPAQGGQACDILIEQQPCNEQKCPDPLCRSCLDNSCYIRLDYTYTYQDAIAACKDQACPDSSNCLVAIDDAIERSFIVNRISGNDSWIESYRGNNYGDLCLSISRYGAITIPINGCLDLRSAICELPKLSTCA